MSATDDALDAYLDGTGATLWGRAHDISSARGRDAAKGTIRRILEALGHDTTTTTTKEHLDLCRKALSAIATGTDYESAKEIANMALDMTEAGT